MSQFITISKYPGDAGQITTCTGKLFVTAANKKQIILCSSSFVTNGETILTTYSQELAYRSTDTVSFVPKGAAEQGDIYPGTEITSERERTWMYATDPMSISGLLSNGQVVATSKKEPLVLYYRYSNGKLGLYLYNLEDGTTTQITSKAVSSINGIESCQFAVGAFASSKQQDIFASCSLLGITNGFFIKAQQDTSAQQNQYQINDRGLGNWCNNSVNNGSAGNNNTQAINNIVILGDFNGDKLSDLLCLNTRSAMINKEGLFRETNLIKNLPGNWADQLSASNNQNGKNRFAIGDYDGNGLSDFASITNGAKPEVLFHNGLNDFISYSGDRNNDGSFILNRLNQWCGTDGNAQVIAIDADNDGVDDILCKNNDVNTTNVDHGKVFLAISRTAPYTLTADQALGRVVVSLNDFTIGENLGYVISDNNVPLFCDARIYEYHTITSCSLNSPNKVQDFTTPVRLSAAIPELEVNTEVKGNVFLGDKDRYGEVDLVNEQVLNEGPKLFFPQAKFWNWNSVNYVDPSRYFETSVQAHYIRQGKISEEKQHLSDHAYGYRVHGGDCNEINFSHITLTNNFTASGKIEAYDQNNNKITDSGLLRNLAEMYILSGMSANSNNQTTVANAQNPYNTQSQIENVGGGVVTFSFAGTIKLQTLYQKNVTHCSVKKINQNDLLVNNNQGAGSYSSTSTTSVAPNQINEDSAVCLLQRDNPFLYAQFKTQAPSITKSPSLLRRSDALELNGIIHSGGAFFPDIIKNASSTSFEIDRFGTQIDDLHSKLNYNNSIELHAYLRDNHLTNGGSSNGNTKYFDKKPHNELMVEFRQNGNTLYEPTKIKLANGTLSTTPASLYAGFDNIKQVKLAAFDAKHILLAWSIYQAEEKQYYLLVDYVNTGNSLLKLPIYEQDFTITITNKRFGNTFYVSYKSSPNKYIVTLYSAESFAPTNTIEVDVEGKDNNAIAIESRGNTKFELQVEEIDNSNVTTSNIMVVRSHNNHQGQFVKKFDVFLNEILNTSTYVTNNICEVANQNTQTPQSSQTSSYSQELQNSDRVPSKIDEGYDVLRLDFNHNSKVVYHDDNRNNNLDKKVKLQNALNAIYKGATFLQTLFANPDQITHSKLKNTVEALVCKSTMPFNGLNGVMDQVKDLLSTDLTYEVHTSSSNTDCNSNNHYPVYRIGNVVHICSGFDTITDNIVECTRLIDESEYVKGLVTPETPQVQAAILENLLPFMPSNVISGYTNIMNSDYTSPGDKASICHEAGAFRSQEQYINHLVPNIAAGLLSQNTPKAKVTLGMDSNSCNSMAARGCSTSHDKQSNNLCLSSLFEMASTASMLTEAAQTNANVRYNCQSGCDLTNPALTKLAASVGGSVASSIDNTFIQRENSNILRKVGFYPVSSDQSANSSTSSTSSFTASGSSNSINNVLASSPTYFYDKNSSLISFAYLGNNYIDVKTQYFQFGSVDPISIEQHLGRFANVKQIQTIAFNQSAVLVGYSVKHPDQSDYNILVQYISAAAQVSTAPTMSKIVNIYPSYNGIFDLDVVPHSDTSKTEFMVATPETSTKIAVKRYTVSKNAITQQQKTEETINAITDSQSSFTVKVNAFLDNTFNVVWSYLDQAGIFLQRYDIFNGNIIGNKENLATEQSTYPMVVDVDADIYNKTFLSWQHNDILYLNMIEQSPNLITNPILSLATCNMTLFKIHTWSVHSNFSSIIMLDYNAVLITYIVDLSSSNLNQYNSVSFVSNDPKILKSNNEESNTNCIDTNVLLSKHIVNGVHSTEYTQDSFQCSANILFYSQNYMSKVSSIKLIVSESLQKATIYKVQNLNIFSVNNVYEITSTELISALNQNSAVNDNFNNLDSATVLSALSTITINGDDINNILSSFTASRQFKAQSNPDAGAIIGQIINKLKELITAFPSITIPSNGDEFETFLTSDFKNLFKSLLQGVGYDLTGEIKDLANQLTETI